jgi:hypothetical protein
VSVGEETRWVGKRWKPAAANVRWAQKGLTQQEQRVRLATSGLTRLEACIENGRLQLEAGGVGQLVFKDVVADGREGGVVGTHGSAGACCSAGWWWGARAEKRARSARSG